MSCYENKRRWGLIGVQSVNVEHNLAPGFGRPLVCVDENQNKEFGAAHVIIPQDEVRHEYHQEDSNISKILLQHPSNVRNTGRLRPNKRRTVPLDVVTSINLQTASVEQVRNWAQAIVAMSAPKHILFSFAFHPTPFEPDFKLFPKKTSANSGLTTFNKQVSFASCTSKLPPTETNVKTQHILSGEFDFRKIVLFGPGRKLDTLTMFPQLIDSCDVPIPLLPCLEENWEKLNLLLWAAYLAKDDFILVKRRATQQRESLDFYKNISMEKTSSGHTIMGRKLFLLHAALFELLPEENITTMEQEYYDTWNKLLQLSMNLSPRDDEGLTPLAVAALAKSPISRPCISKVVIDKILELDPSTAKRVVESNIKGSRRQLPLHLVLQSGKNWDEGVSSVYIAYPDALDVTDALGRSPIHVAASSLRCPGWVVHKILQLRPEAAKLKDRYGRLPLHHAVDDRETWSAGAESIYVAYPEAAFTSDCSGNLPSYFFPSGCGRHLETQFEKKVVNESKTNPELLSLLFGDYSSRGVVHDNYQERKTIFKRPFYLMKNFTGIRCMGPNHRNLDVMHQKTSLSNGFNLRILPEFMVLISSPFQQ